MICPKCALPMREDRRFADELAHYNIDRHRYVDVAGHSTYWPVPNVPWRPPVERTDDPSRDCVECGNRFQALRRIRCDACTADRQRAFAANRQRTIRRKARP